MSSAPTSGLARNVSISSCGKLQHGLRVRVLFDLVGSGGSDLTAFDRKEYRSLEGYADDVLEIVREVGRGPAIFVGHSVSAMIGMLANLADPAAFAAQIMIGPSSCCINDGDYIGGFSRKVAGARAPQRSFT